MTTVLKIMLDTNAPAGARLRAAEIVLEQATKAGEIENIEDRVAKLERAVGAASRPPKPSGDITWLSAIPQPDPTLTRQINAPRVESVETDEDVSE